MQEKDPAILTGLQSINGYITTECKLYYLQSLAPLSNSGIHSSQSTEFLKGKKSKASMDWAEYVNWGMKKVGP